jgi:RNA polymerase sigma-70 factor (ECF subfamily)
MAPSDVDARDLELLGRLGRGDEDAFRRLFFEHAPSATALALRVVRQRQLAEEIVQEAFLTVWRNPEAYDEARGSFRSWLLTLVHHRAVDAVRREETYRRHTDEATAGVRDEQADHAEDVAEEVDRPRERRLVQAALAELPAEQRRVLELMYFDGLSQSQVASETGLPLGTVKSRALLGMRRMRALLEDLGR